MGCIVNNLDFILATH